MDRLPAVARGGVIMQNVSQEWKNTHTQTLLPESFVEITLSLTDPEAQSDASAVDNGSVHFANTAQTVSEVDKTISPYATLEQNLWVLDGSKEILPTSDYGDCGYISSVLSNANCEFTSRPVVTLNFSKIYTSPIPGITIVWGTAYDDYATDFTVTAYNGDTVVATKDVVGNTDMKTLVLFDMVNYDRITITINKWCSPYRRARIEELFMGAVKVYSKNNIFSFKHSQTVDPISASLPKSSISFSLDNVNNEYNPKNTSGLSKYLVERQEIKARYGYKIGDSVEWIDCGTFYMSEWSAPQNGNSADFTARDLLEYMTAVYDRGMFHADGISLYDIAVDVLTFANLPLQSDGSVKWVIDESLRDIYTVAPLPVDTVANCLQLIAHAGCCVLYQDRKGILHIVKHNKANSDYAITQDNSYSKPEITLSKPCRRIVVPTYQYEVGENITAAKVKVKGSGSNSVTRTFDVVINCSEPVTNIEINTIYGTTVNSVEYYANSCKLNVSIRGSDSYITVKGDRVISSTLDNVIELGDVGEEIKIDNPLISDDDRAIAVAEWMRDYIMSRQSQSYTWRSDPRLDCLDVISSRDAFTDNDVIMTKVEYSYNGAFRGSGEGRVI